MSSPLLHSPSSMNSSSITIVKPSLPKEMIILPVIRPRYRSSIRFYQRCANIVLEESKPPGVQRFVKITDQHAEDGSVLGIVSEYRVQEFRIRQEVEYLVATLRRLVCKMRFYQFLHQRSATFQRAYQVLLVVTVVNLVE